MVGQPDSHPFFVVYLNLNLRWGRWVIHPFAFFCLKTLSPPLDDVSAWWTVVAPWLVVKCQSSPAVTAPSTFPPTDI